MKRKSPSSEQTSPLVITSPEIEEHTHNLDHIDLLTDFILPDKIEFEFESLEPDRGPQTGGNAVKLGLKLLNPNHTNFLKDGLQALSIKWGESTIEQYL
jgi:hypothetical protein